MNNRMNLKDYIFFGLDADAGVSHLKIKTPEPAATKLLDHDVDMHYMTDVAATKLYDNDVSMQNMDDGSRMNRSGDHLTVEDISNLQ